MIPKRPFGRTGHHSTRTLFGAAALARESQYTADATLDVLLEYGVNHIDTAATYGDAEERIGPWMKAHRDTFFLATKVEERTYTAAWDSIRRSLKRMSVDQLDLLQLHHVSYQDIWDQVMGPDGALKAVLEPVRGGECQVRLRYRRTDAEVVLNLGDAWRIRPGDGFVRQAQRLLGAGTLAFRMGAAVQAVADQRADLARSG